MELGEGFVQGILEVSNWLTNRFVEPNTNLCGEKEAVIFTILAAPP